MDQGVPPYRPPRSRKPVSFAALLFLSLFFTGILLLLFLKSPLSEIQEIEVTGNRMVPDGEILAKARLAEGGSYYHWDADRAEKALERMTGIRAVTVTRSFPGRIRLDVKEAGRVAYWSGNDRIVPVLTDGTVLFDRPWTGPVDRPLLRGWDRENVEPSLAKGIARLPLKILADISEIRPASDDTYPDLVKAYTRQGHVIRVRAREFGDKVKVYSLFRDRPPGTLNLLESTWFVPEEGDGGD